MCYKCHKINLNQGRSYINSPDWIKNKKLTMNLINEKIVNALLKATVPSNQESIAVTVALNQEGIRKYSERIKILNLL